MTAQTTFPLTSASSDVVRMWLGFSSDVTRAWLGCDVDVARMWLGRGPDVVFGFDARLGKS